MAIRAKFVVESITDFGQSYKRVKLSARYDETIPEDQRFYEATPTGELVMTVNNPAALEQLKIGQAFYIDMSQVPPPG